MARAGVSWPRPVGDRANTLLPPPAPPTWRGVNAQDGGARGSAGGGRGGEDSGGGPESVLEARVAWDKARRRALRRREDDALSTLVVADASSDEGEASGDDADASSREARLEGEDDRRVFDADEMGDDDLEEDSPPSAQFRPDSASGSRGGPSPGEVIRGDVGMDTGYRGGGAAEPIVDAPDTSAAIFPSSQSTIQWDRSWDEFASCWEEGWSEEHGQAYYRNSWTGAVQWEHPYGADATVATEAQGGTGASPSPQVFNYWHEFEDPHTKQLYYFNSALRVTQWEEPTWVDDVDPRSNCLFYTNTETGESTWLTPSSFVPILRVMPECRWGGASARSAADEVAVVDLEDAFGDVWLDDERHSGTRARGRAEIASLPETARDDYTAERASRARREDLARRAPAGSPPAHGRTWVPGIITRACVASQRGGFRPPPVLRSAGQHDAGAGAGRGSVELVPPGSLRGSLARASKRRRRREGMRGAPGSSLDGGTDELNSGDSPRDAAAARRGLALDDSDGSDVDDGSGSERECSFHGEGAGRRTPLVGPGRAPPPFVAPPRGAKRRRFDGEASSEAWSVQAQPQVSDSPGGDDFRPSSPAKSPFQVGQASEGEHAVSPETTRRMPMSRCSPSPAPFPFYEQSLGAGASGALFHQRLGDSGAPSGGGGSRRHDSEDPVPDDEAAADDDTLE